MQRAGLTILVAFGLALAVVGGAAAQDPATGPRWDPPTPAEQARFDVTVGDRLTIAFQASGAASTDVVQIRAEAPLPVAATLTTADGNPATASLDWTPSASQLGIHTIVFVAHSSSSPDLPARLSIVVVVRSEPPPRPVSLTGPGGRSTWAHVVRTVAARSLPGGRGRIVGTLTAITPEFQPNLASLVSILTAPGGRQWVRVRMPVLPLGTLGWVPRSALGPFHPLMTRVVVSRASLRLTLMRGGFPLFRARVGVGKPRTPTPRGEFYVRERLTDYDAPFYGPIAFGTNAISPYLENWPGGGFVGIHGTSLPQLIPGRVSHGCVRLRNRDILRLNKLMPLGTPVSVI